MKTNDTFDEAAIQALMETLPMTPNTPENLKSKLIEIAASPSPRHRSVRRPVFAFAFAGALTVAAVAMFLSIPATAKSWALVKKAVQGVSSMQLEIRDLADSKQKATKVAFAPNVVLVEPGDGEIVYIANGVVQIYEPRENVVREFPMPEGMLPNVAKEVMGEITLSKILAEHEKEFGRENIKVGPVRSWQGRRVFDVVFTKPAEAKDDDGDDRVNIVADEATDLPLLIETFKLRNGRLEKKSEIVARYNERLDSRSLKPKFPPNAKFEKFDISKIVDGKAEPPSFDWD